MMFDTVEGVSTGGAGGAGAGGEVIVTPCVIVALLEIPSFTTKLTVRFCALPLVVVKVTASKAACHCAFVADAVADVNVSTPALAS